jgi:aminoglycoside 6'-N-acetyltransferase
MDSPYHFRPATGADLPLLRAWRRRPHIVSWWGPPDDEDPEEALADPHTAAWIVELGGRPFAYAQDYDPRAEPLHHFARLPPGSRGIDQSIGEPDMLNQGHGSAFVRAYCERLFAAGAPAIATDPHPDNARAIRACEKAGFAAVGGAVATRWGPALPMERWRSAALRRKSDDEEV